MVAGAALAMAPSDSAGLSTTHPFAMANRNMDLSHCRVFLATLRAPRASIFAMTIQSSGAVITEMGRLRSEGSRSLSRYCLAFSAVAGFQFGKLNSYHAWAA